MGGFDGLVVLAEEAGAIPFRQVLEDHQRIERFPGLSGHSSQSRFKLAESLARHAGLLSQRRQGAW